jgi:hypothetical protein
LRVSQLLREEEIKWYQCSKAKHLLEGDTNIKYFHLLANGRHRKMRIFQPTQLAFIPGRNIMKGVIILHETIHELHRKKECTVILKIDFEKAYDKVK